MNTKKNNYKKPIKNTKRTRYVLTNRKRFFTLLMILCVVIFTTVYTTTVFGAKPVTYENVVVDKGDTLWSIATKYTHSDIRGYIREIKALNNLESSTICENTVLVVPVESE